MKVYFEKTVMPCVCNSVTLWHVAHGWVYNVVWGKFNCGVFYCTVLSGDGCIVHFETSRRVPWYVVYAAFKKGVRMIEHLNVVYATIPAEKEKLIRCAVRLGFGLTESRYWRDGREIVLLQYLKH